MSLNQIGMLFTIQDPIPKDPIPKYFDYPSLISFSLPKAQNINFDSHLSFSLVWSNRRLLLLLINSFPMKDYGLKNGGEISLLRYKEEVVSYFNKY